MKSTTRETGVNVIQKRVTRDAPAPSGGLGGWLARNATVIKMVLVLIMVALLAVLAWYVYDSGPPDFGTNPPTPTTITPIPGSLPPAPTGSPTPSGTSLNSAAIAGIVVGSIAVAILVGWGVYSAVKQTPKEGSGLTNFKSG